MYGRNGHSLTSRKILKLVLEKRGSIKKEKALVFAFSAYLIKFTGIMAIP